MISLVFWICQWHCETNKNGKILLRDDDESLPDLTKQKKIHKHENERNIVTNFEKEEKASRILCLYWNYDTLRV